MLEDTAADGVAIDVGAVRDPSAAVLRTETESLLGALLADLLGQEDVAPGSHFFDDLGANSLVMAHFCARVRKRDDLPSISIRDVYSHPSVGALAAALDGKATPMVPAAAVGEATVAVGGSEDRQPPPVVRARSAAVAACGAAQLLVFFAYNCVFAVVIVEFYEWLAQSSGMLELYWRATLFGIGFFAGTCLLPVAAKWLLVGRWKVTDFPVWGVTYVRFWTVKTLLRLNPMAAFVGTPLYSLYLKALGARIGTGVTILSRHVPVCTDLLTIGSGTVVSKDAVFLCYRAHAGRIETGPVSIGAGAFVGERGVLEIHTTIGDGAQLGHSSALQPREAVPTGESWHGSPAERTDVDYVRVEPRSCGSVRRTAYATLALARTLLLYLPLSTAGLLIIFTEVPSLEALLHPTSMHTLLSGAIFRVALEVSLVTFLGAFLLGLLVAGTVPRTLNRLLKPGEAYPLFGVHYAVHRLIIRMTNLPFYRWLFGDSSYIVNYLRYVGYDLSHVEQTGSNFGIEVKQDNPYLTSVGCGTMVADGLSVANADVSSTSFRVSRTVIGPHNFLGNHVIYPAGGRTGDDCLLASKVMVPLDGEVRENVGLLGSPPFEIPRTVERDRRFDHLREGAELRRRLSAKNRYNVRTMALFMLVRWAYAYVLILWGLVAVELHGPIGELVIAVALTLVLPLHAAWFILLERATMRFGRLQPQLCSIYDPYFWWHERLWKTSASLAPFDGTPYKNLCWRLLGVDLGKRVLDDGCLIVERTLVHVGDDCTLGATSSIQPHSQEDGTFKTDRVWIGDGCTIGVGALVHYGVVMGDGSSLAGDSFLMKGEEVPGGASWSGNPAVETSRVPPASTVHAPVQAPAEVVAP